VRAIMRLQVGKKQTEMPADELRARAAAFAAVHVDLGTGDGRFVNDLAGERPDTLCIGVDAVGEAMREQSHKTTRKGGPANALYVVAAVEALPPELRGLATGVSINFPWGSLLRAVVEPDAEVLAGVRALLRDDGRLTALVNLSVLEDRPYAERLGLPELGAAHIEQVLRPAWRAAGLELDEHRELSDDEIPRTSWGRHLTRASHRKTALLSARTIQGSSRTE
jgi:16S rRNA (adenine(1408)-N(1))-methyltransferase